MAALLIVDDDALSREVLALLAAEDGFECVAAESGAAALELLAGGTAVPEVVLTDMQMPGVTGESLARLLRVACGPATALLAMSGSQPAPDLLRGFDGFLLKPFTLKELRALLAGRAQPEPGAAGNVVLNVAVYAGFRASMPPDRVRALYAMCLDDALKRLTAMEAAVAARDAQAYARGAHAIKGSCGMVGAAELAWMAAAMETGELPEVDRKAPFADFIAATERLRRMLDAQTE